MPSPEPVRMVSRAGIEYSVEFITPEIAEEMLTHNTDNRSVRRSRVNRYARDMESGAWREDGAAIRFAKDGTLLDGQHRLLGVVQSGVGIWMLVVRNLPMEAQDTMDDLPVRTLADTFGFHGVANKTTAAAVVRRVLMWQNGAKTNQGGKEPTKTEALEAWRIDPVLPLAVEAAVASRAGQRIIPPSIAGLAFWVFYSIEPDDCDDFMEKLIKGIGIDSAGEPAYIVRNQIEKQANAAGRVSETEFLAWIIKAWNHFRAGRTLSPNYRYKITPRETFPEPR